MTGIPANPQAIDNCPNDAENIIADAILSERRRCADIADDECAGVDDGDYWIAQRIRDRILGQAEVYDLSPRLAEDGCLSHLPQGGGTDSPVTQNQLLPQGYQGGRAMTDNAEFLHQIIENAFSWALQDCNYLSQKYMDRLIAETKAGMKPEQAATWNATAQEQADRKAEL